MTTKLFVYGSLKKTFHNHLAFLSSSRFLGEAVTLDYGFRMVSSFGGSYPIAYYKGGSRWGYIKGELYGVDDDTLKRIDMLEGHPEVYRRYTAEVITVLDDGESVKVEAIMYIKDLTRLNADRMFNSSAHQYDGDAYGVDVNSAGFQSWVKKIQN